ncbi:MAG: hypothetical protein AMS21_10365, partial [Gemmatimonas sp. SG8_38_2]
MLAVIVAAITFVVRRGDDDDVIFASGTVEATEADLGFQTPGRIERIAVREGDRVTQAQELAWLDRTELMARRTASEAQARAARAMLAELESGFRSEEVAQGQAALRAAEQRVSDAQRDMERVRRLHEGGAVSQQRLDDATTAYELAKAEYDRALEALGILQTGPRQERI